MGATHVGFTDRYPYTIVSVSKSKRLCHVQEDTATRTDKNGMSDQQTYEYTPNRAGKIKVIRLHKDGSWKTSDGQRFHVGSRRMYHDYSF